MQNTAVDYKEYKTKDLMRRFVPYYKKHKGVLFMDLFCAGLTTICELVLPMIIRHITNTGLNDFASLTLGLIGKCRFCTWFSGSLIVRRIIIWPIWGM